MRIHATSTTSITSTHLDQSNIAASTSIDDMTTAAAIGNYTMNILSANKVSSADDKSTQASKSNMTISESSDTGKHSPSSSKEITADNTGTTVVIVGLPKRGRGRPKGATTNTAAVIPRSTCGRIVKKSKTILAVEDWQIEMVEAEEMNKQKKGLQLRYDWRYQLPILCFYCS